jgi:tetratricopeptide (TPR) repeat protein
MTDNIDGVLADLDELPLGGTLERREWDQTIGEANELFRDWAAINVGKGRLRRQMYEACLAQGKYEQAVCDFTASIRLDPGNAACFADRGLAYEQEGKYELAIWDFAEALRLDPHQPLAYLQPGNAFFALDDFDEAINDFSQALRLAPDLASACYYRGLAYAQKGDALRAIADQRWAVRLNPHVSQN